MRARSTKVKGVSIYMSKDAIYFLLARAYDIIDILNCFRGDYDGGRNRAYCGQYPIKQGLADTITATTRS